MAVIRRCSNDDGRCVDRSLRNAARAILELAQSHDQPAYNDRQRLPEQKSVVKREPIYHRIDNNKRRYRLIFRRSSVVPVAIAPQPMVALERNHATATVIPNDDEVDDSDKDHTLHHHMEGKLNNHSQKNGNNSNSSSSNLPPIHFRNYRYENEDSHNTGEIGNIASCPMIGKPLSLPPRLPLVGCKNQYPYYAPSFPKKVVGTPFGKCLSPPPSLIKFSNTIEFPERSKD